MSSCPDTDIDPRTLPKRRDGKYKKMHFASYKNQ